MEAGAHLLERRLADALASDLEWLASEVESITGIRPIVLRPESIGLDVIRLHARAPSMPNVALLRSGTLAAASILFTAKLAMNATLVSIIPAAVLGGAAFAVGSLVTKGGARRAGDIGAAAIHRLVEDTFDNLFVQVEFAVKDGYRHLETRATQVRDDWSKTLRPEPAVGGALKWSEIRARAADLMANIDPEEK